MKLYSESLDGQTRGLLLTRVTTSDPSVGLTVMIGSEQNILIQNISINENSTVLLHRTAAAQNHTSRESLNESDQQRDSELSRLLEEVETCTQSVLSQWEDSCRWCHPIRTRTRHYSSSCSIFCLDVKSAWTLFSAVLFNCVDSFTADFNTWHFIWIYSVELLLSTCSDEFV